MEFVDDEPFVSDKKTCFVIAEVTQGECKLNGPWTDHAKENMHYVLRGIGAFDPCALDNIAAELYEKFCYEGADYKVELVAFGRKVSERYANQEQRLLQLDFVRVCRFVFSMFSRYLNIQRDHQHWDFAVQTLWRLAETHWNSEADFIANALSSFGIAATLAGDGF